MGYSTFQNLFQKTLESSKAMENPRSQTKSLRRSTKRAKTKCLIRDKISFVGVAHLAEILFVRAELLSLSFSLSLSLFLRSLSFSTSLFPCPSFSLSLVFSLSVSLAFSLSFPPSLSLSLSLSLYYCLSLFVSLSVAVSQSLTHTSWHTTSHTLVCVFVRVCEVWKKILVTGALHLRCQDLSGERSEASAQEALLHTYLSLYTHTLYTHTSRSRADETRNLGRMIRSATCSLLQYAFC